MHEAVKKRAADLGWTACDGAEEPASKLAGPRPIAVILGWYGADLKHVMKYSQLYTERGFDALVHVAPGAVVFSPTPGPRRELAEECLSLVSAAELAVDNELPPLVFHVFSNGGCFTWEQVLLLTRGGGPFEAVEGRLKGVVYDSCPCELRLWIAFRAITSGAGWNPLPYMAGVGAVGVLGAFSIARCGQESRLDEYFKNLANAPTTLTELFIHSKNDPLCPWEFVDTLVVNRRSLGARVTNLCFEKSTHVAHIREHREEYTKAMSAFFRSALPNYASTSFRVSS